MSVVPVDLTRAIDHLSTFVDRVQKCPDQRSVASLDASDHLTVGDLRAILRMFRMASDASLAPIGEPK